MSQPDRGLARWPQEITDARVPEFGAKAMAGLTQASTLNGALKPRDGVNGTSTLLPEASNPTALSALPTSDPDTACVTEPTYVPVASVPIVPRFVARFGTVV